jgi:hypothetical protein
MQLLSRGGHSPFAGYTAIAVQMVKAVVVN